jgi:hypothetical protein
MSFCLTVNGFPTQSTVDGDMPGLCARLRARRKPRHHRGADKPEQSSEPLLHSSRITFRDGRVEQSNFHDYRTLRMSEVPAVEIYRINSDAAPGGIGEVGTAITAPAILSAVYAATGKRLPRLPVDLTTAWGKACRSQRRTRRLCVARPRVDRGVCETNVPWSSPYAPRSALLVRNPVMHRAQATHDRGRM